IVLPNIPQFAIAFYGTLRAGAVVVLGSHLSNEEEIAYQLHHSGAQVLLTLSSYQAMVKRVCANSNITQVIYTNVREYLPVRQHVKLARLIDETGSAIGLLSSRGDQSSVNNAASSEGGPMPLEPEDGKRHNSTANKNSSKARAQTTSVHSPRIPMRSSSWKQY